MSQVKFAIEARSCTLLGSTITDHQKPGLLDDKKYVIPVYQRQYSWGQEEVRRLLKGIVNAYRNGKEPYFLGTMQLMPKTEGNNSYFEIVDGQQRMTTLLLFFKVLQLQYGSALLPKNLQAFDWLSTRVSKNEHQAMLERVQVVESLPVNTTEENTLNPYLTNLNYIHSLLQELITEETDEPIRIDEAFTDYVLHHLYVVVIETQAGLAKTLDIFNTINTAGMDLNGGDVFKVQLYEYLTRIQKYDDTVFEAIDELYASIDRVRKELGDITSIKVILEAYKYILIERAGASRALHELGVDTFYERLFSCLLLGEKPNNFNREKMLEALGYAPLDDLNRLVKVNYYWEKNLTTQQRTWHMLLWKTRYGRYWPLDLVYLFRYYDEETFDVQLFDEWKQTMVKYYMVKTIQYKRIVNGARTYTFEIVSTMLNESTPQLALVELVRKKLTSYANENFKGDLNSDLYENATHRYLVFWLLAMLEEPEWDDQATYDKFFDWEKNPYDIEHIRARNLENATAEDNAKWAPYINTIGNLVLLERDLNRSSEVKHFDFEHKHTNGYAKSKLKKIAQLRDEHADQKWDTTICQARAKREIEKLTNFLFGVSLN